MTHDIDAVKASEKRQAEDELHRLWLDFVEASTRAQRTLIYADGMAAHTAWAKFMTAYEPPRREARP